MVEVQVWNAGRPVLKDRRWLTPAGWLCSPAFSNRRSSERRRAADTAGWRHIDWVTLAVDRQTSWCETTHTVIRHHLSITGIKSRRLDVDSALEEETTVGGDSK